MIVAQLAHHPVLAHVYVWATYHGPITLRRLDAELDSPASTVHHHVDTLIDFGTARIEDHTQPLEVTGIPIRVRTDTLGLVTPTTVHAIARQEWDDAIAHCVETYGVQTLSVAVRQAGRYYANQFPKRTVADPLGIPVSEAHHLVETLEHVLAVGHAHDPYFADLFPDLDKDLTTFDAVAVEDDGSASAIPL